MDRHRRTLLAAVLATLLVAGVIAVAEAASVDDTKLTQLGGTDGCINPTGVSDEGVATCAAVGGRLAEASSVAVAPGGANVYVGARADDSVAVFDRAGAAEGALTRKPGVDGCVSATGRSDKDDANTGGECAQARALELPSAVTVSPDGKNVYVASLRDALAVFDRDPATGVLTQKAGTDGCVSETGRSDANDAGTAGECADGKALVTPRTVVVSPDGESVYVATSIGDSIAVFDRDPDSGALTQKAGTAGCISENGMGGECANGRLIDGLLALAVTPDGSSLYAGGRGLDHSGVAILDRDPDTGGITQKPGKAGCLSEDGSSRDGANTCTDARAVASPTGLAASPDSSNLYVAAGNAAGISIFDRDPATGALAQKAGTAGCVSEHGRSDANQAATDGECVDGKALTLPDGLAASTAGVYAHTGFGGLAAFERMPDGGLTQLPGLDACMTIDGGVPFVNPAEFCADGKQLSGAGGIALDPAAENAYTAGGGGIMALAIGRRPAMTRDPDAIAFGNQREDTGSAVRSVMVENTGDLPLGFLSIGLFGGHSNQFRIADSTTCDPAVPVPPAGSCRVDLVFAPTSTGDKASQLRLRSNDSDTSPLFVDLTGTGTDEGDPLGPRVELDPAEVEFGSQEVGTRSDDRAVTVRNTGDADLELGEVGLSGPDAADFEIDNDCGDTVQPGDDCEIEVAFGPSSAGDKEATLDVPSNGTGPSQVPLEGRATAPPAEDPPADDPPADDPPAEDPPADDPPADDPPGDDPPADDPPGDDPPAGDPPADDPPADGDGAGSGAAPQLPASGAPPAPAPGAPQTPAGPASGDPTLQVSRGTLSYRSELTISGNAAPGTEVTIESQRAGSRRSQSGWSVLRRIQSDSRGRFSETVRVGTTRLYRVSSPQGESRAKRVRVRPRIALLVRGARSTRGGRAYAAQAGQRLRLPLRVTPMKRRVVLRVERRLENGRHRLVTRRTTRTRRGRTTPSLRLAQPGTYRIRIVSFGDSRHAAGRSHPRVVEVE